MSLQSGPIQLFVSEEKDNEEIRISSNALDQIAQQYDSMSFDNTINVCNASFQNFSLISLLP
jgi:hypothetical protein